MIERFIHIPAVGLDGDLTIPPSATGIVVFAHGSGSSRRSPRNRFVAEQLQQGGLATLLFDLLTPGEERADAGTGRLRFNRELLAGRLLAATDWLKADQDTSALPAGYFGASTGGGAALIAAAQRPSNVFAVVSRGGRPDLAGSWLKAVRAPTLLIVGGNDAPVIRLNEQAFHELAAPDKRIEVVPGATHLFEEPGALEEVATLARDWFRRYLRELRTAYSI